MKQNVYPYYWLIALAGLFFVAGFFVFGFRSISLNLKSGTPVEPLVQNGESALFGFWFAGADFLDLSADRNMAGILFSATNNKVSLLDRGKRLRWEKSFPAEPLQAKLSYCGNYLAVGTAGGQLFYMSTDQRLWWETNEQTPVTHVAISATGLWVAIGRGNPDQEEHHLELYNREGKLKWRISTAPLQNLYISGEHIDQGRVFYSYLQEGLAKTAALTLEGVTVWEHEDKTIVAISHSGNRLAATQEDRLYIYDYSGRLLWDRRLLFPPETVVFNPRNHNLILYGKRDDVDSSLIYLSAEGKMLWQKRVADGSLFAFTSDGDYLVTSSWRHYKDDYSQMALLNESGVEVQRWDVAMRVDHLLVTGSRRFIVLGGDDGYIEVVDLYQLNQEENADFFAAPIYSPYSTQPNLVTLYFSDGDHLVPVARSLGQTENRIRAAVEELIRGPARNSFLYRAFPKEARIGMQFIEEKGQLFLELSPELATLSGSAQSIAALDSLHLTLSGFPEVNELFLTVDGENIATFGDGLILEQPLLPYRWQNPVFIPVRSGERYYLVPREAKSLEIEQLNLASLLQEVLRISRAFYFIPGDLQLLGVYEEAGILTINLNSALQLLFPENGGEEEQLHAALLLDALFLTALENSGAGTITIIMEGNKWNPPEGYPELSRTFYATYFLNPE